MEFLEFSSDALFPLMNIDLVQQQIALLENERSEDADVSHVEQAGVDVPLGDVQTDVSLIRGANMAQTNQMVSYTPIISQEFRDWNQSGNWDTYTNAISITQQFYPVNQNTIPNGPSMQEAIIGSTNISNNAWVSPSSEIVLTIPSSRETRLSRRSARIQRLPYNRGTGEPNSANNPAPLTEYSGQSARRNELGFSSNSMTSSLPSTLVPIMDPVRMTRNWNPTPASTSMQSTQPNFSSLLSAPPRTISDAGRTDGRVTNNSEISRSFHHQAFNYSHTNTSSFSITTMGQQQPHAATFANHPMQNPRHQTKFNRDPSVLANYYASIQPNIMAGGSMTMSVQSPLSVFSMPPPYPSIHQGTFRSLANEPTLASNSAGYPAETLGSTATSRNSNYPPGSSSFCLPLNQEQNSSEKNLEAKRIHMPDDGRGPEFCAALQLAAAKQLLVQAAASASAANLVNFSQSLTDRTRNLDHMMNTYCPTFLQGGRAQMKACLSVMSSANSQSSTPRIPTCSICLDKLVSTIVFPCRHFFCEICAPKIDKCGLCREIIEDRHRVYF